jgi:hypothetical protein
MRPRRLLSSQSPLSPECTKVARVSDESEDPSGWLRLTAELAQMPELASRLIAEHRDDGRGRCIRCTLPGRGTPGERWPCGPAALALAAQQVAAQNWCRTDFALDV